MYNDNENQFKIPSGLMNAVDERVKKLNRKAAKLGCPEVAYATIEHLVEKKTNEFGIEHTYHYDIIQIEGAGPKIEGWTFLGTLDHNSVPGSVIVKSIPGVEFPEQFRHTDNTCDHCGHKRHRNNTYVLQNDEGDYKRVGSTCVKDFIGHDPKKVASFMRVLAAFDDEMDGLGLRMPEPEFDIARVLAVTHCMIRHHGWVSATKARETEYDEEPLYATSGYVFTYLNDASRDGHKFRAAHPIEPQDYEMADAAVEWAKLQDTTKSEYMHNVVALTAYGYVKNKMLGIACSIMGVYKRELDNQREREADDATRLNEHFGEIKKRYTLTLTVIRKDFYDSHFGGYTWYTMRDQEGREFKWKASNANGMREDKTYEVKATVTEHNEYKGRLQTRVARLALQEGDTEGEHNGFHYERGNFGWNAWIQDENGDQLEGTDLISGPTKVDLFDNIDVYVREKNDEERRNAHM